MILAVIKGSVVMAHSFPSSKGLAFFICQPIDKDENEINDPIIAISPFGGGLGSKVLISADGKATRGYVGDDYSPLRHSIVAVLDD